MNVNNFLDQINRVHTNGYICQNRDGSLGITKDRNKGLKISQIAALAADAFAKLKERPDDLLRLRTGLKNFRAHQSEARPDADDPLDKIINQIPPMDRNRLEQFLDCLRKAPGPPRRYISRAKDGSYKLTSQKADRLSSKEVHLIARGASHALVELSMSPEERLRMIQELRSGIAAFIDERNAAIYSRCFGSISLRLDKSNPLNKMLSEIPTDINLLSKRIEYLHSNDKIREENQKEIDELQKIMSEREVVKKTATLFLAKVIDRENVYPDRFAGGSMEEAFISLKGDLEDYLSKDPPNADRIRSALQELNGCLEIMKSTESIASEIDATLLAVTKWFEQQEDSKIAHSNPPPGSKLPEMLVAKVKQLKDGEELIIPGGYIAGLDLKQMKLAAGHAVLYRIKYDSKQNVYSFTTINTGEGVPIAYDPKTGIPVAFDITCPNLSLDKLSEKFFQGLFEYQKMLNSRNSSMKDVQGYIESNLQSNPVLERPHRPQETGSCFVQCGLSWLSSRLGEATFRNFMAHMTKRSIAETEEFMKVPLNRMLFKSLLQEDSDTRFSAIWDRIMHAAAAESKQWHA